MTEWKDIVFENPEWFWLLALIPLIILWLAWRRSRYAGSISVSGISGRTNLNRWLVALPWVLRLAALALIIVAVARPRRIDLESRTKGIEGIDIMLAVDISPSMLSKDLRPNRLDALKEVAYRFIDSRPNDRIGLTVYAGESFTQTPLTTDHQILKEGLRGMNWQMLKNGTAIGMGLATAVNHLKSSVAKSKIIILLTDGENNMGLINPKDAADLARKFNIKVYTIGVGKRGMALSPYALDRNGKLQYRMQQVSIDEELLKEISEKTKGLYFRATNKESLQLIYEEIDQMEKTEIEEVQYYQYDEKFRFLVLAGLILLMLEFILRHTLLKSAIS